MLISNAYAQSAGAAAGGMEGTLMQMWPILLMFVALYFLVMRPQQKRQKEHRQMLEALQKGDEVVITGGIVGKITKIQDTYMNLEIANNVEIVVQRSAVATALPKGTLKSL
jgi:preprotein translocase subunit YajC